MSRGYLTAGVFCTLAGFYLLTGGGHTYVKDEVAMAHMSAGLLDHGWFDVPLNINTGGGRFGPGGRYYMPFGLLQPLLAVPLVALGRLLIGPAGALYLPGMTITWFNAFAAAALFALLARFYMDLEVPGRRAAAGALALAVSTPFWVYSRTFFSEPLAALGTLGSAFSILRYRQTARPVHAAAAGAWAAAVLLVRPLSGAALPVLFLYLVLAEGDRAGRAGRPASIRPFALFAVVVLAGIGLLLAYNRVRFGGIFETGYDKLPSGGPRWFTLSPLAGLAILLVSPGKSLFVFAPPALAAAVGLWRWRRAPGRRPELALAFAMPAVFLAILCRWGEVEGGVAWGPRLLLPALPVLLLALAPLLAARAAGARALVALTVAAGIGVQILGISVNFATFIAADYRQYYDDRSGRYRFAFNPLPGHARRLVEELGDLAQLAPAPEPEAAARRLMVQINYGDSLDFWWIYAWRDGLRRPFIAGLLAAQTALFLAGVAAIAIGSRKSRSDST